MPGQQQEKAFISQSGFYKESLCYSVLGSTSAITDANGSLSQHVLYFAYGEQFVDEHRNSTNSPYLFNGKEYDEETGRYYYGARYYDPRVSLWIGVDPMAGKYPVSSPYAYCINNPIILVDPDGRDIEPTFYLGENNENSRKYFQQIIDKGLEGQFVSYFAKGQNGNTVLAIKATEGGGDLSQMSSSGQAFYKELTAMINDHSVTAKVDVFYGSNDVITGNYKNNAIDIADIMQFNESGKDVYNNVGASKTGKLTHELVEQFYKAKQGESKGSMTGYRKNHDLAIQAENRVNGNTRLKEKTIARGVVQISFKEKNGSISLVKISDGENGIISVEQPKPRGRMR